jgi:tetratricopeptide (TPR) repeat protein
MPIRARIRIRLASLTSREVITTTDDYGKFIFSGLAPGVYTVNIDDDKDYQPMTQQIDIQNPRNALPETYTVSFRLIPKPNSQGRASVVNSKFAGVPQKAIDHYNEAIKLANAQDTKGAIAELKRAIDIAPKFTAALTELGVQQLKSNDLEEADKSLAAALDVDPDSFEATINRGIGLFRQKRYDDAQKFLRMALKLKDGSTVAHYYLGRTLMGLGKLDDAEGELNVALKSGKESLVEAHRMLTQLYIQKAQYEKARQELETYLAANPNAPDVAHLREVLKQLREATAATAETKKP